MRDKINRLLADRDHYLRTVEEEEEKLAKVRNTLSAAVEAQEIIQEVAELVQREAHGRISSVVSSCLQDVFQEEAYEFRIEFEKKRGKTEARLLLIRDGHVLEDPVNEAGGGVIDVAAFALRLACLLSSIPRRRRVLFLDEPFKHINGDRYQSRVGDMLLSLSEKLGVQIIMVTDDEWLKIGKVIQTNG